MPLTPPAPTTGPPAAAPGPPAVLANHPNALLLLKALRRCWLRATVVGVVVAAGAAFAAWSLVPTSTYTARTLMRVPPGSTFLFRLAEAVPALGDHQRTQVALAKSRLVLNAALKQRGVGELNIVKTRPEPIEWLEKEIQADFSVAPEVLRIAMTGENPEELKALVTALRKAYESEILEKEKRERVERLNLLATKRGEFAEKLHTAQASQRQLERAGVAKDAGMRSLLQTFGHMQLTWYEREMVQTQSDLRKHKADLTAVRDKQKSLATGTVAEAEIQIQLATDPAVLQAQSQVSYWAGLIEQFAKASAKGDADPALQPHRKRLAEAEASLAALKKRLTPDVIVRVRTLHGKAMADAVSELELRIATETENEKAVVAQVDAFRQSIQKMTENGVQFEIDREATTQLEEFKKRIGDEEEKLRFELDIPSRFSILEETIVQRAADDKRLIMTTAGAFIGTLALMLLGFSFHEFRARRVDSVEEVVHGLGMNLIGAIPDSAASSSAVQANGTGDMPGHSTLAEAVDATRVMLLRAARSESLRVVMVTSAHSGEGKTSLSTHLAASLAQAGLNTLLIDGDLRNPVAHQVFKLDPAPGFCELLRDETSAEAIIRPTPVERLSMIPAGRWSSGASRALSQDGVAGRIIRQFREEFDFVIIDSSPVLPVVDPLLIGQLVDGTIISVLRDVSRMPSVYAAHQRLIAAGVRVLGAVVNGVRGEAYGTAYPYRQRVG
jgi:succinoglycan biosynthesis transport protein ExoP